jgi:subtilase family serine protease
MRLHKIFLLLIAAFIIYSNPVLSFSSEQKPALPLPDLVIKSVDLLPAPRENQPVNLIKIQVANQGDADASACVLGLSCVVAKCNEGDSCDRLSRLINGDIPVPALKKGEKVDLEWRPASNMIWVSGKYSLVAEIDKYNVVRESNELNNVAKCMIHVTTFSPRQSTY